MDKLAEALRDLLEDLAGEYCECAAEHPGNKCACCRAEQVLQDYEHGLLTAEAK